jgi:hypothetical protein
MARGTRAALAMAELPPDQTWTIKQAIKAVEKALAGSDANALRAAVDALSKATAQIADDVISAAVRKSLAGDAGERQ